MKILMMAHGHPSLHKGGGEVAAYALHHLLQAQGHHSVFVGWGGAPQSPGGTVLAQHGLDDYLLYSQTEYFGFSLASTAVREGLQALIETVEPDIVHLHHYIHLGVELPALIKQIRPQTKVVLTLHEYLAICANNGQLLNTAGEVCAGYQPERCNRCFPTISSASFFMREIGLKSALGFVDAFVAPSQFLADQYLHWGIPPQRMHVVENPLPAPRAETSASAAPHVDSVETPVWRLGFFGQINFYKGLDVILDGVRLAAQAGTRVELSIYGSFSAVNGQDYIDRLKQTISTLPDTVTYHGPYQQADVHRLMTRCHWLVMGSRWYENSPVVIQEAIAAGLPMILPDHGGMKEKSDATTVLFQPGEASSLADALRNLTPAHYRAARKAAMARYVALPAARVEALTAVESIYNSLLPPEADGSGLAVVARVAPAPALKPARPSGSPTPAYRSANSERSVSNDEAHQ